MTIPFLLSRLFSLRLLVVAIAVVVLLDPSASPWLSVPDRLLFDVVQQAAGQLSPAPATDLSSRDFVSLVHTSGYSLPAWSVLATQGAVLVCLAFLVWWLPRMGMALAASMSLVLLTALVITPVALLLYRGAWVPLGPAIAFLLTGLVIMLFWQQPQRQLRQLTRRARTFGLQLARLLLQQGKADEALAVVADCPADDDALQLYYDIALLQERKRQYGLARETYQTILAEKKGYRDVAERLQAMVRLSQDSPASVGQDFQADRTLVLPDAAVSKPILGRYEIERELGRGAMGVVYLGKDPAIARTVAIKTLNYRQYDPDDIDQLKTRFFREAEAAGRLNHPGIVTVYDVGEEADLAFIAMDFARGKPLSAYGKPETLLPLPVVLALMAQAAEALAYAHEQNIVHRDIKPGNLIYNDEDGELKITDFGIAKITDDTQTRTGTVMGSPLYMSPEQLRGAKVTGASDIYSLGVTFYKLVSGETPYTGDTLANLTYQILNKRPRSVKTFNPDVPPGVVRLINKAIQQDPAKRFADAGEMARALRKAASRVTGKEVAG